jgi:hypothetical protein
MKRLPRRLNETHRAVYFPARVAGLTALGAAAGALLFPPGGLLFNADATLLQLARRGMRFLGFIFFIRAPAIGITACVMRAWRKKHPPPHAADERGQDKTAGSKPASGRRVAAA